MTHRVSVQPSVVLSTCVPFISAYFTSAILRITPQTTSNAWVSASVCHLQLPECPKERRWAKGRAWADWGKRWARCRWLWTRLWSPWRRFYSLFARVAKVSVLAATGKHKIQFLLVIKADMPNVGKREAPVLRSRKILQYDEWRKGIRTYKICLNRLFQIISTLNILKIHFFFHKFTI